MCVLSYTTSLSHSNCLSLLSVLEQDIEFFSDAGFDLDRLNIRRNAAVAQLYEDAIMNEGAVIGADGALIVSSILGDRHAMHMCTSTEAQLAVTSCQCS